MIKIKEIWKSVNDYEGVYEVSNLGRVRSLDRYINGKAGGKCKRKGNIELYKSLQGSKHHQARAIINCRGEVFETAVKASLKYGLSRGSLSMACSGKRNYCGKYDDGTPIKWNYQTALP